VETQKFSIHMEGVDPEQDYVFTFFAAYTGLGKQLGEEEWYITGHNVVVRSTAAPDGSLYSRYSCQFLAQRHLLYYVFRLFIPLYLIITVSWVLIY
jgi:hypothetical protein